MGYINISMINTTDRISTLGVGLDSNPPVIVYSYSHTTGLITSNPIENSFEIEYSNWGELLSNAMKWAELIRISFNINQTNIIFPHKLEYEIKANEISATLKTLNNDILLGIAFITSSKIVTVIPRIAINMTHSDFLYWLQVASIFYQLIKRRGY